MDNEKLVCPICGKPTRVYMGNARKDRLCGEHADMLKAGELVLNQEGHYVKPNAQPKEVIKELPKEDNTSELTCIICGEQSNGKHFCLKCYRKYRERTIAIEVKGCSEFTITDAYGNKDTKTANGLYVRSLSEKIIYDELFRRGIKCEYERTVTYKNENGEIKELHPDFYLTDYKLYIEHWGYLDSRNREYEESKKFKEKIYQAKGYRLAATTSQDIKDIQTAIERLLLENDIEI